MKITRNHGYHDA